MVRREGERGFRSNSTQMKNTRDTIKACHNNNNSNNIAILQIKDSCLLNSPFKVDILIWGIIHTTTTSI